MVAMLEISGIIALDNEGNIYAIDLNEYDADFVGNVLNVLFLTSDNGGDFIAALKSNNEIWICNRLTGFYDPETPLEQSVTGELTTSFPELGNIIDMVLNKKGLVMVNAVGNVYNLASFNESPKLIAGLNDVIRISVALLEYEFLMVALTINSELYLWDGDNNSVKKIKLPIVLENKIVDIYVGRDELLLLLDNSDVAWFNYYVEGNIVDKTKYHIPYRRGVDRILRNGALILKSGGIFYRNNVFELGPKFIKYSS